MLIVVAVDCLDLALTIIPNPSTWILPCLKMERSFIDDEKRRIDGLCLIIQDYWKTFVVTST